MVLLGTKSIKRIKLFSLVLAALCVLVLCACTSNESMLMGKWRGKLLVGSGDFYMAFNSDGSYIESTDKGIKNQGTWSLSKSTITVLDSDGVVLTYTIEELKKDKLILVAPIFNMKFQMEKVEDGNTSASNNIPINPIIGAIIAIALLAIIILFVSKKKKNNKISHSVKPSGKSFCGNCGTKLEDGVRFCPNCGKNLSESIAADNVEQTVEYGEEEESPTKKYLPYILCAMALIALIGGGWWYSNSSKPSQAPNREILTDSIESDSIITAIEEEVPANSEIADSITYFNDEISDETIDQDEEEATYENDNNVSDNPNTCWYIYGTKKELESFKVINANGINTDLNKNYFTKISENESKTIKLYSNNARVLSSHPNNSYELSTDDNGNYQLNIILPHEFWSVSKYLVIVVDE